MDAIAHIKNIRVKLFFKILDELECFLLSQDKFAEYRSDIRVCKDMSNVLQRTAPLLVVNTFYNSVSPFATQILKCEESFFLNFDSNEPLANKLADGGGTSLMVSLKLKNIWETLVTNEDKLIKAHLWNYMHKLLKVSEQVTLN